MGSAKAMVLPLPVLPRPRTSRPSSESGNVADWIGNAVVTSRAASTAINGAGTPRATKSVMYSVGGSVEGLVDVTVGMGAAKAGSARRAGRSIAWAATAVATARAARTGG